MVDLTCMGNACNVTAEYFSWMPNIMLLIVTVSLILALAFLVSRMLTRRDLEALIRAEMYQTVIAVVWVIAIAGLAYTTCSLSCMVAGGENPFNQAVQYTNDLRTNMETSIIYLIEYAKNLRIKGALLVDSPLTFGMGTVYFRPNAGCNEIANSIESVTSVLTTFTGSLVVQQMALSFIYTSVFTVVLPIGFILRILPFFRETGALLLGLSLALYIVFPLTYVFADKATEGLRGIYITSLPSVGLLCNDPGPVDAALKVIGFGLVQAAFFPTLSMIITLGSAKALSKVFIYDFQEL
jgi:hypothetical protein